MSLVALAAIALTSPASAATCGQTAFYATYGDNTQVDDGFGTVDDPDHLLYNMPALFLANASWWWGNGYVRTDEHMADAARPVALDGYGSFAATTVSSAFLRFDLYYTHYSNSEGFGVLEETNFSGNQFVFAYYDALRARLQAYGMDRPQWISIRLDLVTGNAFAWRIDSFGNPTYNYGQFTTHGSNVGDFASVSTVISAASDGDLYPMLYDDMTLSYVAFYGITSGYRC